MLQSPLLSGSGAGPLGSNACTCSSPGTHSRKRFLGFSPSRVGLAIGSQVSHVDGAQQSQTVTPPFVLSVAAQE